MHDMSLEEAIASVSFPVYGHTCEVLGFRYGGHTLSTPKPALTLTYRNDQYMQKLHKRFRPPLFSVGSSEGSRKMYEDLVCPPQYDPRIKYRPISFGDQAPDDLKLVEPTILEKEEIIIDGTHFIGVIRYYPDPLYHSISLLRSAQTSLIVHSTGPSLEEVYELIKALRMLNTSLSGVTSL